MMNKVSNTLEKRTSEEKKILDSGNRREFDSGAVRDIQEGKGRCDLLPLLEVSSYFKQLASEKDEDGFETYSNIMLNIGLFMEYPVATRVNFIETAIKDFINSAYDTEWTAILVLAEHYEEGAKKYAERNWEKGMPYHCFIDSGIRHLTKYFRGDQDEPHDRAFLWNMFGLIWTLHHHPECNDLPKNNPGT